MCRLRSSTQIDARRHAARDQVLATRFGLGALRERRSGRPRPPASGASPPARALALLEPGAEDRRRPVGLELAPEHQDRVGRRGARRGRAASTARSRQATGRPSPTSAARPASASVENPPGPSSATKVELGFGTRAENIGAWRAEALRLSVAAAARGGARSGAPTRSVRGRSARRRRRRRPRSSSSRRCRLSSPQRPRAADRAARVDDPLPRHRRSLRERRQAAADLARVARQAGERGHLTVGDDPAAGHPAHDGEDLPPPLGGGR